MRLGYSPVTAGNLDLDSAFRLAEELQLDFLELSADLHEIVPALQDPKRVRELTAATGVGATVHLAYIDLNLASLVPAARRTSVDRTLRGLEFADAVGATCGVLHSGLHYVPHPQAEALVAAGLQESLRALEGPPVPIALENLALTEHDYVRGPEQLAELTRRHGFSNCFDFGHAHVEGACTGRDLIRAYLETLGERVIHLHVHDNDGTGDQHLPTGSGGIDYARHAPFLASFAGTVCLEIVRSEEGVRESVAHLRDLVEGAA